MGERSIAGQLGKLLDRVGFRTKPGNIIRLLKRLVQRLLIFGLGIFYGWLIVLVVFETADRRLNWILPSLLPTAFPLCCSAARHSDGSQDSPKQACTELLDYR